MVDLSGHLATDEARHRCNHALVTTRSNDPQRGAARTDRFEVRAIGHVESMLSDPTRAPKQGDEGAPDAVLVLDPGVVDGLAGTGVGDHVIALTWLHQADRGVLQVHPRHDVTNPLRGVFTTRSPDRPNPIGLHEVEIVSIDGRRIGVRSLEAVDGTPLLDLKPVLPPPDRR
jgi:tRNA-Thr(GGU) m(6)t(6)A37 methyltransferase TsaA